MKLSVTAKIRILPDNTQKELLIRTMNEYRNGCNLVSKYVFATHDLSRVSIHRGNYGKLRSEFSLRSQMCCSIIRTVIGSYKAILTNENKWIEVNYKKPILDLVWNRDYSLKKDYFSVNTLEGRIKIPYISKGLEHYFNSDIYEFGTAKLVFKHGKFFLHISVSFNVQDCKDSDISNVVGVDRGINFVITTYNSKGKTSFVSGRKIKNTRGKYKALRTGLQKRQTASSRRRLKRIGNRENRWMQDVNHCISKALVLNNPKNTLFVLEDLTGIRSATESVKKKDRYISVSWSFYDLEQKIDYKCKKYGSRMIKVDPAYTSQTCPKCGHTEASNRHKDKHIFICRNCGYTSNDDRIGAMNLYRKGIEYLVPDTVADEHDLSARGLVSDPKM